MRRLGPALLFLLLALLVLRTGSFELQDTIHSLMEENIHLHDQLENLTRALRELRQMLLHHSNDPDHHDHHEHHSEDVQHLWDEWFQHSINSDTLLLLEQVFCGHAPHGSASPVRGETSVLLLIGGCLAVMLMSCS